MSLIEYCRQFSPIVGLEPTDRESILLDITGLAHLFGGETALCETIIRDLARRGLAVGVAIADTIGTAWAGAHYGRGKAEGGRGRRGKDGKVNDELRTLRRSTERHKIVHHAMENIQELLIPNPYSLPPS